MAEELKEMNDLQRKVFMLLPNGANNLISTQEIEDVLEIDKRHIMGIVVALIMKYGIPVGSLRQSNNYGYFIATNEEEKLVGTYSIKQQVNAMNERVARVKEADLTLAPLYKEKYKDEAIDRDEQLSMYECMDSADEALEYIEF